MCVVIVGWLGWLAIPRKIISQKSQYRKYMCRQSWLTLLTCRFSQNYSSRDLIFENMYIVNSGWLGWLAIPCEIISGKNRFWNYMCCQSWLTWLTCRFLQNYSSRDSIFENMYVIISSWLGWLSNSHKIISLDVRISKYVFRKQWLTWVTCRVSQFTLSRYLIFETMYVVNSGWLGWLIRIRFSQLQFSKLYPLQTLFKWLTFHSLVYIFSSDSIQNMYVAIVGWLGWLSNSRKIISLDV